MLIHGPFCIQSPPGEVSSVINVHGPEEGFPCFIQKRASLCGGPMLSMDYVAVRWAVLYVGDHRNSFPMDV